MDLLGNWLKSYNDCYGDNLSAEQVQSWEIHRHAKFGYKIYEIINRDGFYEELDPLPGAITAVNKIRDMGHKLLFVTASMKNPNAAAGKLRWVMNNLDTDRKDVIIAHNKYLIKGDVFIDDSPSNIKSYREHWPSSKILTISYPYNAEVSHLVDLRADFYKDTETAWASIVQYIRDLSE